MTARARGRWAALVALAAATLLPLTAARRVRARWDRGLAARDASAAAGYLAIVTPMARSGGGYDLPQLLIRARALAGLPGLAVDFEIYDRTAPLVHATAPPLLPAVLEQLRREVAVRWTGEAMLAPLLDRDGWDVVGAVAAQPQGAGWPVSPWSFAALLLFVAAGVQAVRAMGVTGEPWRQALGRYGAAAGLFGVAMFADVRLAGRGATDQWLSDARLLMQEAMARVPETRAAPASLAPIARGAELAPADSLGSGVVRRDVAGLVRAVVAVRLGPGRWVELRARPLEAGTAPWLAVVLGLAALGPLGALLAGWSLAASPRQRRETVAAWGFLAPSALHLVAFTVGPLLFALYLSVHRFSPVEPARPLIGLAGYAQALGNPPVWAAAHARRIGTGGLGGRSRNRAHRGDDRLRVDAARVSDGRVSRRAREYPSGVRRCRPRGRRERVAAVPARDAPAAPAGDPVRAGDRDPRRVPGVRSGRGSHGGRSRQRHGRGGVSDLPDRLGAAPVRRCQRTLCPALRAPACGYTGPAEAPRPASRACVGRKRDE